MHPHRPPLTLADPGLGRRAPRPHGGVAVRGRRPRPGRAGRELARHRRGPGRGPPWTAGGSSLSRLLAERRGRRAGSPAGALAVAQVLAWADRHRRRTGRWPTAASGPVADAPGENWRALNLALREGYRGLPGGGSLARLLGTGRRAGRARDQRLNRRDREIAAARSRGETLRVIAARYGLSRQRVQQIVREERRRRARKGD
jgi:hypothetical protein